MKKDRIVKTKGEVCTITLAGLTITFDLKARCFYFYMREHKKVHRTIEPVEGILIDLDAKDRPLGIEIIWH